MAPIPLHAIMQQTYGQLNATNDWAVLSAKFPESNIAYRNTTTFKKSNTPV
jgi:hypothetical protein